jgi:hypothetical protein
VRVGIFDHFGWAAAVTATPDGEVLDRRRIELVAPGLTRAPVHYDAVSLDDAALTALIAAVRHSVSQCADVALDHLEHSVPGRIESVSLRRWPDDFPTDLATLRRAPYESRADAVMYRQVLAEVARRRGWRVHQYDAKAVLALVTTELGDRAADVLDGPRHRLGPPWTKEHRVALAAAILAG